jgi:hypothetical protein
LCPIAAIVGLWWQRTEISIAANKALDSLLATGSTHWVRLLNAWPVLALALADLEHALRNVGVGGGAAGCLQWCFEDEVMGFVKPVHGSKLTFLALGLATNLGKEEALQMPRAETTYPRLAMGALSRLRQAQAHHQAHALVLALINGMTTQQALQGGLHTDTGVRQI